MLVEKPLIGQTVNAPYMKDANNDILFTMKYIEMNFAGTYTGSGCFFLQDLRQIVYEKQRLRPIVQSETSGQMVILSSFS